MKTMSRSEDPAATTPASSPSSLVLLNPAPRNVAASNFTRSPKRTLVTGTARNSAPPSATKPREATPAPFTKSFAVIRVPGFTLPRTSPARSFFNPPPNELANALPALFKASSKTPWKAPAKPPITPDFKMSPTSKPPGRRPFGPATIIARRTANVWNASSNASDNEGIKRVRLSSVSSTVSKNTLLRSIANAD
ncbi:hypothetical protein [Streptomyces sp. NBC_01092]|uniref:hypothetical protein n=1 Tax=Streptomyces sp. NBC_01092 TaxID=2903748 RepID=UPI003868FDD2|nr:hypothetical protein OG254_48600 [Streptomyces sp. NBC_01092]